MTYVKGVSNDDRLFICNAYRGHSSDEILCIGLDTSTSKNLLNRLILSLRGVLHEFG